MAHKPRPNPDDYGTNRNERGSYLAAVRVWEKAHENDNNTEVESTTTGTKTTTISAGPLNGET